MRTLIRAAICLTVALSGLASAAQPPFSATIDITGDLNITVGETTTLTAVWSTNSQDVTRCEWSVDGVGQGVTSITGASSGSSTFVFTPAAVGNYEISFRIWHHIQTARDASNSVYVDVTAAVIEAAIDIDPDRLNLESEGVPVTCYVMLPEGYDVADIDVGSILLNDEIPVAEKNGSLWYELQDSDDDSVLDTLMVKFDRAAVQALAAELADQDGNVELVVTGALTGGPAFTGTDTIVAE